MVSFDIIGFNVQSVNGTIYLEYADLKERYTECTPLATLDQLQSDKENGFLTEADIENRLEHIKTSLAARFVQEGKTYDREELEYALSVFVDCYC